MTTNQMHYFIVTAETPSFTRTAERLFLTRPTLSRHIKRMEELGAELFRAKHPEIESSIRRANRHDLLFGVAEGKYATSWTSGGKPLLWYW